MKLHINGEENTFATPPGGAPFTLAALIESLEMKSDRVAVELNREIVSRDRWPETPLKDGDRLEIVHFVGGGSASGLPRVPRVPRGEKFLTWPPARS
jgi:thiamine biosynthesis protein ThiS